jgi:hypothetical protein
VKGIRNSHADRVCSCRSVRGTTLYVGPSRFLYCQDRVVIYLTFRYLVSVGTAYSTTQASSRVIDWSRGRSGKREELEVDPAVRPAELSGGVGVLMVGGRSPECVWDLYLTGQICGPAIRANLQTPTTSSTRFVFTRDHRHRASSD